jgi:hypothetical protein
MMSYLRRIVRAVIAWVTPDPDTGGPGGAIG